MKRLCAVSCGKAKKGKADANVSKTPLRHFVPPPPQRGEEFSPFGSFLPFLGVIKFLYAGISLALAVRQALPIRATERPFRPFRHCCPFGH